MSHLEGDFHYKHPIFSTTCEAQSMSRRGNCLDNAPMESFFWHFKDEKESTNLAELYTKVMDCLNHYNYTT